MIIVKLTPLEARALVMAGAVHDAEVENAITVEVRARGNGDPTDAVRVAAPLIEAALSARNKIAEATRYEIEVVDDSTSSTGEQG